MVKLCPQCGSKMLDCGQHITSGRADQQKFVGMFYFKCTSHCQEFFMFLPEGTFKWDTEYVCWQLFKGVFIFR